MTLRRLQLSAALLVLSVLFLASGAARPAGTTTTAKAAPAAAANWTWEGCWTQFSAGTCRDIYRDRDGNHWICGACGSTGSPGPGKCNPISSSALASGFWCS